MRDAAIVPSTLMLLPEYSSLHDPIDELRQACRDVVAWLVRRHPHGVSLATSPTSSLNVAHGITQAPGQRIGRALVIDAGGRLSAAGPSDGLLVVASGSATQSLAAPGSLDERSHNFDDRLVGALRNGDSIALENLDETLASALWCQDVAAFRALGRHLRSPLRVRATYAGAPFGVQYWAGTWTEGPIEVDGAS